MHLATCCPGSRAIGFLFAFLLEVRWLLFSPSPEVRSSRGAVGESEGHLGGCPRQARLARCCALGGLPKGMFRPGDSRQVSGCGSTGAFGPSRSQASPDPAILSELASGAPMKLACLATGDDKSVAGRSPAADWAVQAKCLARTLSFELFTKRDIRIQPNNSNQNKLRTRKPTLCFPQLKILSKNAAVMLALKFAQCLSAGLVFRSRVGH